MKWVYGILRNGQDYKFQRFFLAGKIYYGIGDTLFNSVMSLSTNILFINYRAGKLEIDGTVHPILYSMADEIYFKYNNVKYKIEYNGRYGLTKAFGAAICKRHSFHLSIPVAKKNETAISCEAKFGEPGGGRVLLAPSRRRSLREGVPSGLPLHGRRRRDAKACARPANPSEPP